MAAAACFGRWANGQLVHFGWPVINAECPELTEELFHSGIATYPGTTQDLYAAIGEAKPLLGYRDFGHGTLRSARAAAFWNARAPVDHWFGLLHVDGVVGQRETHALVIDEELAEGWRRQAQSVAISWQRWEAPDQRTQCESLAGARRICAPTRKRAA